MKRNNPLFLFLIAVVCILSSICFAACDKTDDENGNATKNYPVIGIWTAEASWHQNSSLNYGGNEFALTVSYDFQQNNVVKSRSVMKLNNKVVTDTDWFILNATWEVSGNVITLSNGKKFVIADDEFNDTWDNPKMTLHFRKTNASTGK